MKDQQFEEFFASLPGESKQVFIVPAAFEWGEGGAGFSFFYGREFYRTAEQMEKDEGVIDCLKRARDNFIPKHPHLPQAA